MLGYALRRLGRHAVTLAIVVVLFTAFAVWASRIPMISNLAGDWALPR